MIPRLEDKYDTTQQASYHHSETSSLMECSSTSQVMESHNTKIESSSVQQESYALSHSLRSSDVVEEKSKVSFEEAAESFVSASEASFSEQKVEELRAHSQSYMSQLHQQQ